MPSTLSRENIVIPKRQRSEVKASAIAELKQSIRERGLFHAPGFRVDGDQFALVFGETRLRAIMELQDEGVAIAYNGELYATPRIPHVLLSLSTLSEYMTVEYEENQVREDLSWQDRDAALVEIHRQRASEVTYPPQTVIQTAREIVQSGATDRSVERVRVQIAEALVLDDYKDDPAIQAARNHNEAYNLAMQREEEKVRAELIRRRQAAVAANAPVRPQIEVIHGNSYELLPTLRDGTVDLILSDPPYGVGANSGGFRDRSVQHHNYSDTREDALNAIKLLLVEGWRIAKTEANIFIFTDIDHFPFFKEQASAMGWEPFRTPITWRKSLSEGLAPWGRQGPRRTTEWIFFATKGRRGLLASPVDCLEVKRVHRSERIFGAQKPIDLMSQLIECATLPGDVVLDPFLGSGASLAAARRLGRYGVGIEKDPATYNTAMSFVFAEESDLPEEQEDAT